MSYPLPKWLVQCREAHEVNTDPLRRCYDGCHFSSEWVWGEWRTLGERDTHEEAELAAQEWREYQKRFGGDRRIQYRAVLASS